MSEPIAIIEIMSDGEKIYTQHDGADQSYYRQPSSYKGLCSATWWQRITKSLMFNVWRIMLTRLQTKWTLPKE